jgi:dienelactone hydrolase
VKGRSAALLVLLIVVVLAGLVAGYGVLSYRRLAVPDPTGAFAVGRAILRWSDASRKETLGPAPGGPRQVIVVAWYPAIAGSGTETSYFPGLGAVASALVQSGEVSALGAKGLRYVHSRERLGARVDTSSAPYPVVILSPDNGTDVEFYDAIAGDLASHGYIVLGINHPYDVAAVMLADGTPALFAAGTAARGTVAQDNAAQAAPPQGRFVAQRIVERARDVMYLVDRIAVADPVFPAGMLAGMDAAHIGIMGHSLGGLTATEACRRDGRLDACLNIDGQEAGGPFSTNPAVGPSWQTFMFLTRDAQIPSLMEERLAAISGGSWRVVVSGARHDSFTDGSLLFPVPFATRADDVMATVRKYVVAFFDQALRGQASPLLQQSSSNADVMVEAHPRAGG